MEKGGLQWGWIWPDQWQRGGIPKVAQKAALPIVREGSQETLRQQIEAAVDMFYTPG